MNIEQVDYRKFIHACYKIAEQLPKNQFTQIYGIPRGGLVPATYISHLTGLPLISYPDTEQSHTLIIDDIADTGKTLQSLKNKFFPETIYTATLYYHKQSTIIPDIWIYEKKDDWINFPWELEKIKN